MSETSTGTRLAETVDIDDARNGAVTTLPSEAVGFHTTPGTGHARADDMIVELISGYRAERAKAENRQIRIERSVGGLGIVGMALGFVLGEPNISGAGIVCAAWSATAHIVRKVEPAPQSSHIRHEDEIMRSKGLE